MVSETGQAKKRGSKYLETLDGVLSNARPSPTIHEARRYERDGIGDVFGDGFVGFEAKQCQWNMRDKVAPLLAIASSLILVVDDG